MSGGRTGAAVKRAGAVLGALAVCAFAGEAALRLLAPFPEHGSRAIHSFPDTYHPLLGWTGVPNLDTVFTLPDFSHRIRNNQRGFRDRDHAREKAGKRRIVVLGDSTAWGWGVEAEERFSDRMERMLPGWEVLNLAQAGYSTDQELLVLETEGLAYGPELVLLLFDRNDVAEGNNARLIDRMQPKPWFEERDGALELRGVPVPRDAVYWARKAALAKTYGGPPPRGGWEGFRDRVLARSHLHNWISFRLTHPARRGGGEEGREDEEVLDARMGLTKRLLSRMHRLCAEHGARFVIADVPSEYSPFLARFCRREGIPHLDLRPALTDGLRPVQHRRVGHWNRLGHRLVAGAAVDFLEREGLLEGRAERQGARRGPSEGVKAGRCEGAGVRECEGMRV
ncbi:MAG: SGNH/GDSL hydrolase family protein [Candidatus Aureabacteria bacterium]|nr:SGNH/GDSL hydrolase family protein [Candidatus Auribacterota bacterium]NLW93840.1 hypothetical protein [Chlamydiota bacterium]